MLFGLDHTAVSGEIDQNKWRVNKWAQINKLYYRKKD